MSNVIELGKKPTVEDLMRRLELLEQRFDALRRAHSILSAEVHDRKRASRADKVDRLFDF